MIKMEEIESLGDSIVSAFKPRRIVLFGSFAYGEPTEDSDVDLLVILPFVGKPARKAIEMRSKLNPKVPLELLVRTPEQVTERIAAHDWFMQEIIEKGRVLYEADHS